MVVVKIDVCQEDLDGPQIDARLERWLAKLWRSM